MIRYGIIGRNFVVDMMMDAMAVTPEAEPFGIYSRNIKDALDFSEKYELPFFCSSLDVMADCEQIDAVYIASPNSCHYEQAKFMLEHGKHVLCEKPACSNAEQTRELVQLAEEKGLIFLEGMRPVFGTTLPVVQGNLSRIGQIRHIRIDYAKPSSRLARFLAGEDVNTFNPALSNASIMDLGCYGIHSIVHLFGRPESITAQAIHLDNGFEAVGSALMHYPDFIAEVTYSKIFKLNSPCYLAGEKGTIFMDNLNNTERVWLRMNDGSETDLGFEAVRPNDMVCELKAFDRFVHEGIRPVRENEDSIITAELIDEARRQTRTVFPSDPEDF